MYSSAFNLHPSYFILSLVLLLAGCESVSFKSALAPNAGKSATFQAAPEAVFAAAVAAFPRAGFIVTDTNRSRGTIEGRTATGSGGMDRSLQTSIEAQIAPADGGATTVTLRLWRIEEDRSGASGPQVNRMPVMSGPTCDALFAAIREQVETPPAPQR